MTKLWQHSMLLLSLSFLNVFHQVLLATNSVSSKQQVRCHDYESSALFQFKQSFRFSIDSSVSVDPYAYPKLASWNTNESGTINDCCSWDGVVCSEDTGHVIGLNLSSSFLFGPINSSSSLFLLVHLQRLNLSDNYFMDSQIPSGIASLSQLRSLDLSLSGFSGQIPKEISRLTQLTSLDLAENDLQLQSLSFEHLVQSLKMLEELYLGSVNISSQVPHSLANLTSLRFLGLTECRLTGEFPSDIFHLPELQYLSVRLNEKLVGSLPEFRTASRIEELQLAGTSFSGRIPDSIGNLKSLVTLDLHDCFFSKSFPASLGNLTGLTTLDLSDNGFKGRIPHSIGNLKSLVTLDLSNCSFSGSLPASLGNLTGLTTLYLSDNGFKGRIPDSIGNLKSLVTLDLSNCFFSGSLPASLGNLTGLTALVLRDNDFKGRIPSLASLSELRDISLSNNEFDGGIMPNWLGKLAKLTDLRLYNTNLYGVMPSSLSNLTQLTYIDLYSNHIYGQIPSWLMNLTQLIEIDFDSNSLQGPIPATFSQLKQLSFLSLTRNNLSGIVEADAFLNLKKLRVLQLSDNMITFMGTKNYTNATLPQFQILLLGLCNLKVFPYFLRNQNELQSLQLNDNYFDGRIPEWFLNSSKETLEVVVLSHNNLTGFEKYPRALPWVGLRILDLSYNMLQGSLPVPPPNTMYYTVQQNKLTGEIPPQICQMSSLHTIDLSHNNLTGIIPQCLGNQIISLSILILKGNNFQGTIPNSFVKGSKLKYIDISENQLQGQLPRSLANCSMLQFVNFADNSVDDNFPFWLGILSDLRVLILRSNKFHGEIKSSLLINFGSIPKGAHT